MGLRLNIGCGGDLRAGWVNIDAHHPGADRRMRVQDLDYPDGSVEHIEAVMVLEHLGPDDARAFARNARRMLAPGGVLVIEVPDLLKVCQLVLLHADDPNALENSPFGLRGIFGDPTTHNSLEDVHRWGYTPASLTRLLTEAGFTTVTTSDGLSHGYPLRDLRAEARR
ncbi:MAG: methyltransferase domain-containing protein [Planctomycetota bacterium]